MSFLYDVTINQKFYKSIDVSQAATLTGYSESYLIRSKKKSFDLKINACRHGKHKAESICPRWGAADTETCYRNVKDKKDCRIWSYQIGFHPSFEKFDVVTKILKNNHITFYTHETCLLFDNENDFLKGCRQLYLIGLRTLFLHNLKYDAFWLAKYFPNRPSMCHENDEIPHTEFLLHNGRLYKGRFYLGLFDDNKHAYIEFIDSYKTLVGSLRSVAKAYDCEHTKIKVPQDFYLQYREKGHKFTDLELIYNSYDVLALCEAIVNFDKAIYAMSEIHALDTSHEYPRLKTAAGIAYDVTQQSVKEHFCINCKDKAKCTYFSENNQRLCQKTGKRKNCVKYLHAFNRLFPRFLIESKELKEVLKAVNRGRAYTLIDEDIVVPDFQEQSYFYNIKNFKSADDMLCAYAFDSYKGAITMAVPERAGKIFTGEYSQEIFCKENTSNNKYIKHIVKKEYTPTGWVEDYTSLYPSRMRLEIPAQKTSVENERYIKNLFLQNPEKITRRLYNIPYWIKDISEYIENLALFLENKNDTQVALHPSYYNGYYYLKNYYFLNAELYKKGICEKIVTGEKMLLSKKYFIVNAKISFKADFYFFQIMRKYLTGKQLEEWSEQKGYEKKGISFRQYQKNTLFKSGFQKINVKMPLDELIFYKNLVESTGGFFELEIIDGIGIDLLYEDENPLKYYVDFLAERKAKAKGVERSIIKLLLNSSYGKFGTKAVGLDKSLTNFIYKKDNKLYTMALDETSEDYLFLTESVNFVPVASCITSHGRMHLLAPVVNRDFYLDFEAKIKATEVGGFVQGQLCNLVDYVDTDSMYVINRMGFKSEKELRDFLHMDGDGKNLGEFKCENELVAFKTLGAKKKQYVTFEKGKYLQNHTTIAGVNRTLTMKDFYTIAKITTKKSKVDKETGVILIYDAPFEMAIKDKEILRNEQILINEKVVFLR